MLEDNIAARSKSTLSHALKSFITVLSHQGYPLISIISRAQKVASGVNKSPPGSAEMFMSNGLHLYSANQRPKRFTILPNIPQLIHIHRWRCQPRRATASSSGAVRVRCLAQGHLDTHLGGAGTELAPFPVTRQPALPPEPNAAPYQSLPPPGARLTLTESK